MLRKILKAYSYRIWIDSKLTHKANKVESNYEIVLYIRAK